MNVSKLFINKLLVVSVILFVFNTAQAEFFGSFSQKIVNTNTGRTNNVGNDISITESTKTATQKLDARAYAATDMRLGTLGEVKLPDGLYAGYKVELQTTESNVLTIYDADIYIRGEFGKVDLGQIDRSLTTTTEFLNNWQAVAPISDVIGYARGKTKSGISYTTNPKFSNITFGLTLGTGISKGKSSMTAQTGMYLQYAKKNYKVAVVSDTKNATSTAEIIATASDKTRMTVDPSSTAAFVMQYILRGWKFGFVSANTGVGTKKRTAMLIDVFHKIGNIDLRFAYGTYSESSTFSITDSQLNTIISGTGTDDTSMTDNDIDKKNVLALEAVYNFNRNISAFAGYSQFKIDNKDISSIKNSIIAIGGKYKF